MHKGPVVGLRSLEAYTYAGSSFPVSNSPMDSYIQCPCDISSWLYLYLIIILLHIHTYYGEG